MQKKILVIEDELPILEAITIKLEKNNFEVVSVSSVEEAFHYLENVGKVDAVWLDHYLLGKKSGLFFVSKCKHDQSWCKNIPIFVVSNSATSDKAHAYLQLGVTKYYVKQEKRLDEIIEEIKSELENQEYHESDLK